MSLDNSELVNQAIFDAITTHQKITEMRDYLRERLDIACSLAGVDDPDLKMGKAKYNELCKMLDGALVEGRERFTKLTKPTKVAALNARDQAFEKFWNEEAGRFGRGLAAELDLDEARHTLDKFIAKGLPMELLYGFVTIAMRNQKLPDDACWRYFCGCAWRRIREEEAAREEQLRQQAVTAMTTQFNTSANKPFKVDFKMLGGS